MIDPSVLSAMKDYRTLQEHIPRGARDDSEKE